ncbi:hypothetical protein SAY86_007523 [Trapa natans]|uniref:1-phosphatidylinositol-3-phosphate 5-kinase n=1 Tax=Trapa natans TaxID=22666 RepID=A0AAN7LF85_TRANT|nr:hypothetical protein SAY86_007523 [Trapa natans]
MGTPDNRLSELVDALKSWIPSRAEPVKLSQVFWMPDRSCRVCYECDSQFTFFNRRHHCRLCGRVFCAKCTANTVPATSDHQQTSGWDEWERIRVCNFCFKQRGQEVNDNGCPIESTALALSLSPSPSAMSLASSKSGCTCISSCSTAASTTHSTGPYQQVLYNSSHSNLQFVEMDPSVTELNDTPGRQYAETKDPYSTQYNFSVNRSDDEDEDDDYGAYHFDSEAARNYSNVSVDEIDNVYYGPYENHCDGNKADERGTDHLSSLENLNTQGMENKGDHDGVAGPRSEQVHEASGHVTERADSEHVDYEKSKHFWIPPEPEDGEDEGKDALLDDDDDDGQGTTGEWGCLRPSNSFGSGEYRNRDKSIEEHKKAMKNVVESHFRALIAQLLQVENLPVGNEDRRESWLDIIASLSWDAATILRPDMSKGGGMDPGGYVKIKCIACGHRSESKVVRGVVCKKNVAHRRMTAKIEKPRLLILGGALEYQRVSNHLSSFDTLLQQEMDHLKMAVAKIDAHHPNVLLVEKSVSRFAQDYILSKDISLVLNIKRPLLERIARCTGAHIVPSIDHLILPKLGSCDSFHVEKYVEEHGSAGQGGKKLTKTLMFFDGCPKPLGCTVLLKGANGNELKKVKHIIQYGVFAAYHLALETSFLADEGASLPELPLKSPITVALPDKPSGIERSISMIPGFAITSPGKPCDIQGTERHNLDQKLTLNQPLDENLHTTVTDDGSGNTYEEAAPGFSRNKLLFSNDNGSMDARESSLAKLPSSSDDLVGNHAMSTPFCAVEIMRQHSNNVHAEWNDLSGDYTNDLELAAARDDNIIKQDENTPKEEFPSSSDHQSILVSLSTRCVWKGTVCERAHIFRIKYYGSFDKPLGRYLRDHLLDENYRCHSCEMPSEAHVHCYTHVQGSLTISVKKLQDGPLRGEREGKIWMWHRCLRCPRKDGFPPATRRVVMSDAAWGLSFGKFLELSFSNHAAASRVATCGHSLHRDCLRFYGYGRMVACFRYAAIDVHSVYLPPPKLEFNYDDQEWIDREANELCERAKHACSELHCAFQRIKEKLCGAGHIDDTMKASDRGHLEEWEKMLLKEQEEFQESLQKVMSREAEMRQPTIDILEIDKLRRQLLVFAYIWDQRLIEASRLLSNSKYVPYGTEGISSEPKENPISSTEKPVEMKLQTNTSRGFGSYDSLLLDKKRDLYINQVESDEGSNILIGQAEDIDESKKAEPLLDTTPNFDKSVVLEAGNIVRRAFLEGEFSKVASISDTIDAVWTGENSTSDTNSSLINSATGKGNSVVSDNEQTKEELISVAHPPKVAENMNLLNFVGISLPKTGVLDYNPAYARSFWELERQSGARTLLPVGFNGTVVPVFDDEPTSIISYALISGEYHAQISDTERPRDSLGSPLFDSMSLLSLNSLDETTWDSHRSFGSTDESILSLSGIRSSSNSQQADLLSSTRDLHARVSFSDEGKVKYSVICYYAKQFEALRKICCPSEMDYVRSLSRCKKWGAQGGKSNVFFAKTLDDRFIIKQVTKTELESFIKFAPAYFKYLSESISSGSPTCLAKILGIYQVSSKHLKGGKESKMDVLVMENLLFRRNVAQLYDLKGSSRSRYNPDTSGNNKVLLDQNLVEAMATSPIFVGNKAKRLLERAVWNDTAFLASIDVMDYSMLAGVDEERHELVLGIIDFMRQYTWDKHLETWVKTSGILGGSRNESPTVISPQMYKKRFRKAMTAYFVMVPDQWTPPMIIPSRSQSDLCNEKSQCMNATDIE